MIFGNTYRANVIFRTGTRATYLVFAGDLLPSGTTLVALGSIGSPIKNETSQQMSGSAVVNVQFHSYPSGSLSPIKVINTLGSSYLTMKR